ncbi:hypothetical protein Slin15195_G046270 [Septoria linicola]|uniref:Zn(2)-C6 fungal-type domain-containing protein n=1 Tax=Septoria linicola TaxID=215465 RepID=A0A9Q9AQL7_9PEZI|nr:hypothetical protein Slin14017_G049800 [Septoria linicola]USW51308.1 hypothetical protein Slin15195_G046270 [Septoria linicola]
MDTASGNGTSTPRAEKRRRVERVLAACDLCKSRKVKCDGELPCSYCKRKNRAETCIFSPPKQRSHPKSAGHTPSGLAQTQTGATSAPRTGTRERRTHSDAGNASSLQYPARGPQTHDGIGQFGSSLSPTASRDDHHDDTVVPLEGRILRDAQGKVIFIGDCAPLSFLQTVRHLIASEVDAEGFPAATSRDSIIEVARPRSAEGRTTHSVQLREVEELVRMYAVAVSGLADLFDHEQLLRDIKTWAGGFTSHQDDATSAVYYLVLAVGAQESHDIKAEAWFRHAKDILLKHLTASMNVATVQGFALVAIFMLRAFQPNGAYLYFSLAARTAYAIGLHRTEVNASYGEIVRAIRDRIWKSLRVVDMLISNLLGRPPSTSDVDCTVKYGKHGVAEVPFGESPHVIDASVQIFMIIERVVVEVYSRKRISLRIASYVSHQLKGWASAWLRPLSETTARQGSREAVVGACSTLCSYYYGIMLLTRPFLIYELYEYMGASLKAPGTHTEHQEKRKYADAALEAAASFVDTLQAVLNNGLMPQKMPLVVSWLFTTALVLAVGVLGGSGSAFQGHCKGSIQCLDYFAKVDPHARQYSLIVQALLQTTTAYVEKRELKLRSQRKQASSQLFGLLPLESNSQPLDPQPQQDSSVANERRLSSIAPEQDASTEATIPDWTIYDADFFAMPWLNENDQGLQDFLQPGRHTMDGGNLADIPLFPMYDQVGGDSLM